MASNKGAGWTGSGKRISKGVEAQRRKLLPPAWSDLVEGRTDVRDLDDEEVFTGRLRTASGALGPKPAYLPKVFVEEQQRRMLDWASSHIRTNLKAVLATITEIACDPNNAPADRLKASFWIAERFLGKVPERIQLSAEDPVETLFRQILQDPEGLREPVVVRVEP